MPVERGDERLEVARQEHVVGVAEGDQLALRLAEAAVAGGRDSCVLLAHDANRVGERRGNRVRAVARAVVHHHHLEVAVRLPERGGDRRAHRGLRVEGRDDDRDPHAASLSYSSRKRATSSRSEPAPSTCFPAAARRAASSGSSRTRRTAVASACASSGTSSAFSPSLTSSRSAAHVGRHQGRARGERLQRRQRQALPVRGEHDDVGRAHQRPRVRSHPQEPDAVGDARLLGKALELVAQRARARDRQDRVGHLRDRVDRERVVLLLDEAADGEHEPRSRVEPELRAVGRRRRGRNGVGHRRERREPVLLERGLDARAAGDRCEAGEAHQPDRRGPVLLGAAVEAHEAGRPPAAKGDEAGRECHGRVVGVDHVGPRLRHRPPDGGGGGRDPRGAPANDRDRERLRVELVAHRPRGRCDEDLVPCLPRTAVRRHEDPLRPAGAELLDHVEDAHRSR